MSDSEYAECISIAQNTSEDAATPDDLAAHAAAMEEYRRGETVAHENIDWN